MELVENTDVEQKVQHHLKVVPYFGCKKWQATKHFTLSAVNILPIFFVGHFQNA